MYSFYLSVSKDVGHLANGEINRLSTWRVFIRLIKYSKALYPIMFVPTLIEIGAAWRSGEEDFQNILSYLHPFLKENGPSFQHT